MVNDLTQDLYLILLCIFLIRVAMFYLNKRKIYKLARKIPGPKGYPLIGNSLDFLEDSTEKILQKTLYYFKTNSEVFKFWIGYKLIIGVSTPEYLEIILNHKHCLSKDPLYDVTKPIMGNGLFNAPVSIWKKNRKLMNPLFTKKFLESLVPILMEYSKLLMDVLEENVNNANLDIFRKFNNCIVSFMCEAVMGVKHNAQVATDHFGHWLDEVLPISLIRMSNIFYSNEFLFRMTKYHTVLHEMLLKIHNYTNNIIKEQTKVFRQHMDLQGGVENYKDDDGNKKKSFLDLLLHLSVGEAELNDEQIKDEITTLIVAGTESSANTMSFCCLLLGMHPDVQQKVYEEIMDVIGKDREITPKDLPRLQYLERCIKESMRLFPLTPLLMRISTADIDLGKFTIPEGSTFLLCTMHTHRNPKYWKKPLKFDPDRFLPEETTRRHPYSYLPFSAGPRGCIGLQLAMMEIKIVMSQVIRKFMLKTQYKSIEEIDLKVILALRPVNGFKVWIEPRI